MPTRQLIQLRPSLRADLRVWLSRYKMNTPNTVKTPFGEIVNNHDGTVTDNNTGLMWMSGLYGKRYEEGRWSGDALKCSWKEATKFFGRSSKYFLRNQDVVKAGEDGEFIEGFKPGSQTVRFAGFSDWRLATATEAWTLSRRLYKDPSDEYDDLPEKMYHLFSGAQDSTFWTCSSLDKPNFLTGKPVHAWALNGIGSNLLDLWPDEKWPVLLVR